MTADDRNMDDIRSLTKEELAGRMKELGEKSFRTKQIFCWLHQKKVCSFDDMTDLSKSLRSRLKEEFKLSPLKIKTFQESKKDGTRKYLFELDDGNLIEGVFMRYRDWNTVCISSQAGCDMGCSFCASTVEGCAGSLTAAEMLDEVYAMEKDTGERVSDVVVMGSGEPLLNYDALISFIKNLTDKDGKNLSARSVTVSTCGIVPGIKRLAEESIPVNLALSLHAPTNEKRRSIMPITKKYPLEEVIKACRYYFEKTGRRITFEYALISGVNDTGQDAEELRRLLSGFPCHINLIPVNPVRENGYRAPDRQKAHAFKNTLENFGINVTIRRELGGDIDGACGQLRRKHL